MLTGANRAAEHSPGSPGRTPCPRCGPGAEIFSREKIAVLAAQIPIAPSLAAEEGVYKKRLAVCGACDSLRQEVLCSHCGCFVLFRARPASGYCPHPEGDKWNSVVR